MARPSAETLARVPLFAGLEPRELSRIAESFKERQYSAGDTIATEGQGGAGFFIIGEGTAKVTVRGEERGTLGPGDYFGEIALIDEGARTATVTADTDMTTYAHDLLGVPADRRDGLPDRLEARPGARAQAARGRRSLSLVVDSTLSLVRARRGRHVRMLRVARERDRLGARQLRFDAAAEDDAADARGASGARPRLAPFRAPSSRRRGPSPVTTRS